MRLDNERPSTNVEDRRSTGGMGGGLGFPGGGGGIRVPMGGGRGMSFSTILILILLYFGLKLIFGIDLMDLFSNVPTTNLSQ